MNEPHYYSTKKMNRIKKWLIGFGCLSLLFAYLIIFQKHWLYVAYDYIREDHFTIGQNMYATRDFYENKSVNGISLFQLMRPLEPNELSAMDEYKEELNINKKQFDVGAKPSLFQSLNKYFTKEKMEQFKTGLLGTYAGEYLLNLKSTDGKYYLVDIFAIKPNKQLLEILNLNKYTLPPNYTWADTDSTLYIAPLQVSKQELPVFKKK